MMGKPPFGFVMVSQRKYEEFAQALGMHPAGAHLKINGEYVGWRTNRRVYVDPATYFKVFGRRPHGSLTKAYDPQASNLSDPDDSIETAPYKNCPTCGTLTMKIEGKESYKCQSCNTAFLY
jgi:hypothetical protein